MGATCNLYCFKCKKKINSRNTSDQQIIKRKLKNGLTTSMLHATCDKCDGKVCSILGNQK